eukprot:3224836-Prymnesium_polylepis.2
MAAVVIRADTGEMLLERRRVEVHLGERERVATIPSTGSGTTNDSGTTCRSMRSCLGHPDARPACIWSPTASTTKQVATAPVHRVASAAAAVQNM